MSFDIDSLLIDSEENVEEGREGNSIRHVHMLRSKAVRASDFWGGIHREKGGTGGGWGSDSLLLSLT